MCKCKGRYGNYSDWYMQQFCGVQIRAFHDHCKSHWNMALQNYKHIIFRFWYAKLGIITKLKNIHLKGSRNFHTFRSGSSLPAKASSNDVFPELGRPNSNVILPGLIIPLTSLSIGKFFFLSGSMWKQFKKPSNTFQIEFKKVGKALLPT